MVDISPCMKAHGTVELANGHFSPLGQYTSFPAPCRLMLSREHGKQNLWWGTLGHCTKCVSSSRSWHNVHFKVVVVGIVFVWVWVVSVAVAFGSVPFERLFASLDVTVVDDTCRLPDERRPLEEPEINIWNFFLEKRNFIFSLLLLISYSSCSYFNYSS